MHDRLACPEGRAAYARRKVIAEPPFGQIQEARRFRRFSMRGLSKARLEWAIVCLAHNALELLRALIEPLGPAPGARLRALLAGGEATEEPAGA